jgi:hypothetical protein
MQTENLLLELFSPQSWTLASSETPDDIPTTIENGVYSLIPTTQCHIEAKGPALAARMWFTSPVCHPSWRIS